MLVSSRVSLFGVTAQTGCYSKRKVWSAGRWLPLAFVSLAGMAREAGWEAEIYDAMTKDHGLKEIEAHIRESRPDFVAITSSTSTIVAALVYVFRPFGTVCYRN